MATSLKPVRSMQDWSCHCGDGEQRRRENAAARFFDDHDDAALAKEMNALSVEERTRVLEDVHGVADEPEESPDFVEGCLKEFDAYLASISYSRRRDLDRAVFLKPSIQRDQEFKLMFLRSENYNARLAAERMVRYFAFKRGLFGEDKLAKKIMWSDLDDKDIAVGKSGGTPLVLSQPDRTGRPVMFMDASKSTFDNMRHVIRYNFHLLMGLLEQETAQKKGLVALMFSPSTEFVSGRLPAPSEVFNSMREGSALMRNLPIRTTSMHFCYDSPMTQFFISIIRAGLGKDIRLRLRTHFGSRIEMKYSLLTFGIQTKGIILSGPQEEDEKPQLWQAYQNHWREQERIETVRMLEEQSATRIVAAPTPNDILIGRGRPFQGFIGNERFVKLVDTKVELYKSCKHLFEKTKVILDVIKEINEAGGNFVKRCDDGWKIVEQDVAIERVRKQFQAKPGGMHTISSDRIVSNRSAKRLKVGPSVALVGA